MRQLFALGFQPVKSQYHSLAGNWNAVSFDNEIPGEKGGTFVSILL